MKNRLFFILISLLILGSCEPDKDKDPPTMQVDLNENILRDPCGDKVVLRGVNKMVIFDLKDPTGDFNFKEIAKTNANCVRIAWGIRRNKSDETTPVQLETVINNCIKNNMVPIIGLWDYTDDTDGGFSHLSEYVDFWTNPVIVKMLIKHQGHLIINIANEAGESIDDENNPSEMESKTAIYVDAYKKAIERIRSTGLICPLMIDGLDRGKCLSGFYFKRQNQSAVVAHELLNFDIRKNLIFSVHTYWPISGGADEAFILGIFQKAINAKFPFVVGELCKYGAGLPETICEKAGEVNYQKIAQICQEKGIGWMAWEWGIGNGFTPDGRFDGICQVMDMTLDSQFSTLKDWGKDIVYNKEYGLLPKSKKTSWYGFDFIACRGGSNIPRIEK